MDVFQTNRSLVKKILENATAFEWTIQGFGMLRLRMPGDARLHVWSADHSFPNVSTIHDHSQWGLTSMVIAGGIFNRIFQIEEGEPTHMGKILKCGMGGCDLSDEFSVRLKVASEETILSGQSYHQEPDVIHESVPLPGTVSFMQKHPTGRDDARVFWEIGTEWGTAEPRVATKQEIKEITQYALDSWLL